MKNATAKKTPGAKTPGAKTPGAKTPRAKTPRDKTPRADVAAEAAAPKPVRTQRRRTIRGSAQAGKVGRLRAATRRQSAIARPPVAIEALKADVAAEPKIDRLSPSTEVPPADLKTPLAQPRKPAGSASPKARKVARPGLAIEAFKADIAAEPQSLAAEAPEADLEAMSALFPEGERKASAPDQADGVENPVVEAGGSAPAVPPRGVGFTRAGDVARAKASVGRLIRPKPERVKLKAATPPSELPAAPRDPWDDLVVMPAAVERKQKRRLRVVGYLRYSSLLQSVKSLIRQAELIGEFCDGWEFDLIALLKDEATSGTIEKRPGLEEAIKLIANGEADILLAEHCDRFARKHSILPNLFDRINDLNAQLWTLNDGHIKDGVTANLLGAMAAEDRRKTVERFVAGQRILIKQGRFPRLPFGYRRVAKNEWVIDEGQAEIVRLVFKLYRKWVSASHIAAHLDQIGVPAPRGPAWSPNTILWMLKNPIYVGVYLYSRKSARRPNGGRGTIKVEVSDLAIISREEYEDAAAVAAARAPVQGESRQHFTYDFLHKKVFSARTKRRILFDRGKRGRPLLTCQDQPKRARRKLQIPLESVRATVLEAIERRLQTPEGEAIFDGERDHARELERKKLAGQKISLSLKLADANAKADATFEDGWMEGASHERRTRRRMELEAKVAELEQALQAVRRHERVSEQGDELREDLKERLARVRVEGCPPNGSEASFELLHAMRSILVSVEIDLDVDQRWFDITTRMALNGDAEFYGAALQESVVWTDPNGKAPRSVIEPIETVTDVTRIYMRAGRESGDEFMTLVCDALERGWLRISKAQFERIAERVPAFERLPASWSIDVRIRFLRAVLAVSWTRLPVQHIDKLFPQCGKVQFRYNLARLTRIGGMRQLGDALDALQIPGLPAPGGKPMITPHMSHLLLNTPPSL